MRAIWSGCQPAASGLKMKLATLFSRSRFDDRAHDLYDTIVAHSRQPDFYRTGGVPDTIDGRFDMIVLHAALVMARLRRAGEPGRERAQALFDLMFADMDRSLREMGVGDLKVGRRVKVMVKAFYGRAAADGAAMTAAVRRNVFGTVVPIETQIAAMVAYVQNAAASLAGQQDDAILSGKVDFPAFDG
jgi:cytochrome b pre-mRNA-processing protein 3